MFFPGITLPFKITNVNFSMCLFIYLVPELLRIWLTVRSDYCLLLLQKFLFNCSTFNFISNTLLFPVFCTASRYYTVEKSLCTTWPVRISHTGKMYWKNGITGLPYAKKVWRHVKPFPYNIRTYQTDIRIYEQKCYISTACQHCCAEERKKSPSPESSEPQNVPHLADCAQYPLNVVAPRPVHVCGIWSRSVAVDGVFPEDWFSEPEKLQRLKARRPMRLWTYKTVLKV